MIPIARILGGAMLVALAGAAPLAPAVAAPILAGSVINFGGQSTCSSTTCSFSSAIVTGGTGSFSNFTFGTPATFFTLTFNPFTPQQFYTTTNALGQTASFTATAQVSRTTETMAGLTSYTIRDSGISQLTGFDPTPGWILFTANQDGAIEGSFSATSNINTAVPEPAAWAMMLAGFGAIGVAMRRRREAGHAPSAWKSSAL